MAWLCLAWLGLHNAQDDIHRLFLPTPQCIWASSLLHTSSICLLRHSLSGLGRSAWSLVVAWVITQTITYYAGKQLQCAEKIYHLLFCFFYFVFLVARGSSWPHSCDVDKKNSAKRVEMVTAQIVRTIQDPFSRTQCTGARKHSTYNHFCTVFVMRLVFCGWKS